MENLDTIELFIDEENREDGIYAISLVEFPAIEENFVALSQHKVEFKTLDEDKRVVVGLALVPDKKIYRRKKDYEYNITFSKDTVRKASELYLKSLRNNNTTLEHQTLTSGVSVIESWIVEDERMDKSNVYGLNAKEGSWVVTMKVDNDAVWQDIKDKKYLGLSIEGIFSDKVEMSKDEMTDEEKLNKIIEILKQESVELKTYNDYPQAAKNNAKRALKWKKENGSSCGTSVGWTRANQLANGESLSRDTIARMASFKRHQQNKDVPYSEGCGGLMWDAWGGSAGVNWAISKLKEIDNE
jgi:hypothetical protein